ncbi:putative colanic acid biosynthesis acetyltransferase [Serratia fonticola]|uniref:Colanic acid biosynthesis acetyltransferase n=1 Tax=Serratia fonticola TaxID=47917 RepID=A0AAE7EJU6_SERFO|nr:putative colanic acid biosynthesis acetyltransferase [Serratia fonticola]MCO7509735.1 putative colanic acid biosynthesis acetyltransferase [Serratia fonticola]QKJ59775.1 putative colanic acid biosynthesis acetyltransferase [Serratia fonticola]
MNFELDKFRLPKGFRGKNAFIVQLWWLVDATLFRTSPQLMYKWRVAILRLFGAKIGSNVIIRPSVKITYPWKISIGDNSWVGDDVTLYSLGNISIGSNTIISQKSYLCTGGHDYKTRSFDIYSKPITIGDSVWVAADVFISPGTVIDDNVIVGARSSVFKNLQSNSLYLGNPAVFVKKLDSHI